MRAPVRVSECIGAGRMRAGVVPVRCSVNSRHVSAERGGRGKPKRDNDDDGNAAALSCC